MWWLERQTSDIRRVRSVAAPSSRQDAKPIRVPDLPIDSKLKPQREKPQREKLVDTLTDAQREANKRISQDDCGHEVEIAQLKRDIASLEAIVRSQNEAAAKQAEQFESERLRLHRFVAGYEGHVAACRSEIDAARSECDAKLAESAKSTIQVEQDHASEARRLRGMAEAAELHAATRAETLRRWQQEWLQISANHAATLRHQRAASDRTINALKSDIESLTASRDELRSTLDQTSQQLHDANTERENLSGQLNVERSRWQIDRDIADARLESLTSDLKALAHDRNALQKQWSDAQQKCFGTEEAHQCELAHQRFLVDAFENQAYTLKADVVRAANELADKQTSLDLENNFSVTWEQSAYRIHRSLHDKNAECSELRLALTVAQDELSAAHEQALDRQRQWTREIDQCREQIANASRDHQATVVMLEREKEENQSLHRSLEKTHQEVAEAWSVSQLATDRMQRHEAALRKMHEQEQRLIEVHQSQLSSMQREIDQRDAAIETMQSTIDNLHASVNEEHQNRVRVERETAEAIEAQSSQLQFLASQREQLLRESDEYQRRMTEQIHDIETLKAVIHETETARTETAKLKAQLSAGRARGTLLIQQYRDKLKTAEQTIARYRDQLETLRSDPPQRRAA